ncbi:MAG TPA: type II toxin-antitoxin system VapC family toxin [Terracidiphilus sp.]|jgi:predicted nucleic acid-binding protein|nr:type II toxin-antitoxin system VapC family toxin [Terracidiphilus sp.]
MSRIFFDTNVFIYLFEDYEPFSSMVDACWQRMMQRGDRLVTSAMTLGELLVKPTQLGAASLIEQYDRTIRSRAQVVNFDTAVAWRYASLRATHKLRNADAIQLASASHYGVDLFITNDKDLHKLDVPGIGFIAPLDRVPL